MISANAAMNGFVTILFVVEGGWRLPKILNTTDWVTWPKTYKSSPSGIPHLGPQDHRRKAGMIDRIREMLGSQTKSRMLPIHHATLPGDGSI